jgi:hypothetical protein
VLKRGLRRQPSASAQALETSLLERMPERNILDVLANVAQWTGWPRHFGPLSGSEPKLADPVQRYILTVFAYGCNLGPTQAARPMQGLATAHELSFTNRRHASVAQIDAAIKDLVNAYHRCDLAKVWGSGSSAAADGTKYELAENSLLAEYAIRYGGYRGIAYHPILPSVLNRTRDTLLSCTQRMRLTRQHVGRSITRSVARRWQCRRRAGREQALTHPRVAAREPGGVRAADLWRR